MEIHIKGVKKNFTAKIPLHPDYPNRGSRRMMVKPNQSEIAKLYISRTDLKLFKTGSILRLIELFNIEIESLNKDKVTAVFHSSAYRKTRKLRAPLIHWIPNESKIHCEVIMPDKSVRRGFVEKNILRFKTGDIVQFQRFGFGRIDSANESVVIYWTHK
jgi:glutamyl-tRNA synthetase